MTLKTTASELKWNIATLVNMIDKKKVDFNTPVQRGYVWDKKRNSKLIHSIMITWPTSVFYFNRVGKSVYEGLEGKQRSNAIYEYVKGVYKLHASTPPVIEDGTEYQVAKLGFSELPEVLQNKILQYGLDVYAFDDMTMDEKVEFFIRINSGKPATSAEIARIRVKSRNVFLELVEHPGIISAVTPNNRKKGLDEDIVENIWCMCFNENPSLLKKHTGPILATTDVTEEQKDLIINALDYINALFVMPGIDKKVITKIKAKSHLVSLGYMGFLAFQRNMAHEEYVEKVTNFFGAEGRTATISKPYNDAVGSGSSKPEQVKIRMSEIEKALA